MTLERARISEWMDLASSGDPEAFGSLAAAVQDDLYRFALTQGLSRADAADAVQETLLRAYRSRSAWRKGADAPAWLYGIAMNVARESRRKQWREETLDLDLDALADGQGRPASAGRAGPTWSPAADAEIDPAALVAAIQKLPPRQREAIICRFLLEMSVSDTAAAMDCAEGTVKAAVFAGLEHLRKVLKDER